MYIIDLCISVSLYSATGDKYIYLILSLYIDIFITFIGFSPWTGRLRRHQLRASAQQVLQAQHQQVGFGRRDGRGLGGFLEPHGDWNMGGFFMVFNGKKWVSNGFLNDCFFLKKMLFHVFFLTWV